ncbi:hypothetical protein DN068_08070 [Taibaiella soli]|uniref:Uncharacterized protein n=1 Tax=Taibaiella soli TaxID=1649169 RepID=A0A2W2AIS8_9BACT|nr:hypothetical protein DN068_08070 [Taibaiella soli]
MEIGLAFAYSAWIIHAGYPMKEGSRVLCACIPRDVSLQRDMGNTRGHLLPQSYEFLPQSQEFLPLRYDFLPFSQEFLPLSYDFLP